MEAKDRFTADLAGVFREGFTANAPLALAVSGGPDSMAMLWLAAQALPGRVIAASVDHGLRPDSAAEAAMVSAWCGAAGVPHAVLRIAAPPSGNLQAWARQERYRLLKRWAIERAAPALATAHHADDQAETFLMRAARGAGLSGLAAIRRRLDEGADHAALATIRPLLGWRRTELRALCEAEGLPFVDDPGNADARFDRARFRGWLEAAPWIDPAAVGRSAAYLAEVDRDHLEVCRWLHARACVDSAPGEQSVDVAGLPRGVRRLIARIAIDGVRAVNGIGSPPWSWATGIEPLIDALEAGRAATQAGVLVTPRGDIWRFAAAPPRRG